LKLGRGAFDAATGGEPQGSASRSDL